MQCRCLYSGVGESRADIRIKPVGRVTGDPAPIHSFTIAPIVRVLGLWYQFRSTVIGEI